MLIHLGVNHGAGMCVSHSKADPASAVYFTWREPVMVTGQQDNSCTSSPGALPPSSLPYGFPSIPAPSTDPLQRGELLLAPRPSPAWYSLVLLQLEQELLPFSLQGHQPHV